MRSLLNIIAFLLLVQTAFGQAQTSRHYPIPLQRFLANYVSHFAYEVTQNQLDPDSASIIACAAEHVPHSRMYDELYDDGTNLPGNLFIEQENIPAAKSLLPQLAGSQKIRLELAISNYYIHRSGTAQYDMDSAARYANDALKASLTIKNQFLATASYITLGKLYFQTGDTAKTRAALDKAVSNSRQANDAKATARALFYRAECAPVFNPARIPDYNEATSIYHNLKDTVHEILAQNHLFTIYFLKGKLDTVEQELYRTMALEKAIGFKEIHYSYTVISFIDSYLNKPAAAMMSNIEAVNIMEALEDTVFSGYFYSKMGALMQNFNDVDECLFWYNKVLQKKPVGHDPAWYNVLIVKAETLNQVGKSKEAINFLLSATKTYPPETTLEKLRIYSLLGYCYTDIDQFAAAKKSFDNCVVYYDKLASVPQTYEYIINTLLGTAQLYINLHDIEGAEKLQEKAKQLMATNATYYGSISNYYNVQYMLDSARGNMAAALENYKLKTATRDSVFAVARARQLEEFKVKFDIAQKEKDLKLLQSQSDLQQTQLEKAAFTRKVYGIGLILVLLTLGLLYSRYRLISRQRKEISQQKQELENLVGEKDLLLDEKDNLITEKEWLIKEIHHRVKNNLQMVVSLLAAQSAHLQNKEAYQAIKESEQRMHAMSLIHQKLYQSDKMELIEMSSYIRELTGYLNAHSAARERIHFQLDLQPTNLDVAQAVPLALILNEAITNALKYAFSPNESGVLVIQLQNLDGLNAFCQGHPAISQDGTSQSRSSFSQSQLVTQSANPRSTDGEASARHDLELRITDNGKGLPEGFDIAKTTSLGITLMKGLARQLKGSFQMISNHGLQVIVRFPITFFDPKNQQN